MYRLIQWQNLLANVETNNLRAIYRWHPQFAGGEFIKYFGDENINYDHATLEGGDVLVIGRGRVDRHV